MILSLYQKLEGVRGIEYWTGPHYTQHDYTAASVQYSASADKRLSERLIAFVFCFAFVGIYNYEFCIDNERAFSFTLSRLSNCDGCFLEF